MFKVYWTDAANQPHAFDTQDLSIALQKCNTLRQEGHHFVTMVSENPASVGKPGVSSVESGRLPDGSTYDWRKSDRVGMGSKRPPPISTDNMIVKLDD